MIAGKNRTRKARTTTFKMTFTLKDEDEMENKKMENKKITDKKFDMFIKFLDRALDVPEIFPKEVIFMPLTDEEWKTIFTERRIELIRAISEKRPRNINTLAKILKRKQEAVSRDIRYLKNLGIIKLVRKSKEKIPTIEKKVLIIPIVLPKKKNETIK